MDKELALAIVLASVVLTLYISYYARRFTRTTTEFYVAGRGISWKINGLAMLGDYCSAASFLGVAGAIALMGIDAWWIALGFFGAWIVVLPLVAGQLRAVGKFTVGDVLITRFGHDTKLRMISMITTLVLCTLYLVPQMVGAGHLFKLLLGWDYLTTVIVTGVIIILIIILGGMKGTTLNQAIQGLVLWGAMFLLLVLALVYMGGPTSLINSANEAVPPAYAVNKGVVEGDATKVRELLPNAPSALTVGVGLRDLANQMSLVLGLLLGVLGLPHILIRFYTVPDVRAAQKSTELTIWGLATFYAMTVFVGLACMYLLYPKLIGYLAAGERGIATNMAVPMLAEMLGGGVFLGLVAAGALAAMLSTSAGLLIAATTSLAHDLYASIIKPESSERERVTFAKIIAGLLGLLSIAMAIWLKDVNVGILVGMCFGIASSTFAMALVLTIWWRRLTREAVIAGMAAGLVSSLIFTFARFFGLESVFGLPVLINPALYSVPIALSAFAVTSYLTKDSGNVEKFMVLVHRK